MFKKKKAKNSQKTLFEDLVHVKKEINAYTTKIDELDKFDEQYESKKKAYEKNIGELLEVREIIENKFLRDDGSIYIGLGYEIKELREDPEPELVLISAGDRSGHFSIQGTTRVGKTVLMLNGNIRQNIKAKENVICIDPKGGQNQEVLSAMVEFAHESNMLQYFKYYSLAYPELSDKINPFFGMSHEERGSLMASIASIGNSETFFTDVVYQMTYAVSLCFNVLELSNDPYGKKTNKLIILEQEKLEEMKKHKGYMKEIISQNAEIFSPDEIDLSLSDPSEIDNIDSLTKHNSTLMTFRDLSRFVTYESLQKLATKVYEATLPSNVQDNEIISNFEKLQASAELEMGKILEQPKDFYTKISISLATLLTQMSQGAMGDIFCGTKINPMLGALSSEDKRLISLIHPFPLRFKKISDMSSRIFLLTVENMLGRIGSTGRGFNAKVNVHVDEAASVAYPGIERLPAQAGGLGANLYFYTQSFADWVKALGSQEAAKIMMDNLNTQVRFRMKDEDSASRVVAELGTIDLISSSAMVEGDGTARMMMAKEQRWFANSSDILKQKIGRIVLTSGTKSYLLDTPFWSGPKGTIVMPEIDIEKKINHLELYNKEAKVLVDQMITIQDPLLSDNKAPSNA